METTCETCEGEGCDDCQPDPGEEDDENRIEFADPGGNSALRAATASNPRDQPCPNCKRPGMLTPKDVQRHYQCDICADIAERGGEY